MTDNICIKGEYKIIYNGETIKIKNKLTDAGLALIASFLTNSNKHTSNGHLYYLAVGTDGTAVTGTETKLGNEIFRTAYTAQECNGNIVTTTFSILSGEANESIKEIGVFCGEDANYADSGVLLSRILWEHTKTQDEEITIIRTDTIGRG